jgi:2-polyprenyl-6-methoxyphenol hydroxylase-like FAD-dependent oxidoreductase
MLGVDNAIVIGAGIGGLTTAIALRQAGVDVRVYEHRDEPSRLLTGGGFMLWHNAFWALRQIKLDARLAAQSSQISFHEFRSDRGYRLARWKIDPESERFGAPAVALRRSVLHTLLTEEAGDVVTMGARCTGFTQDTDGVTVEFADGSTARTDVLIGADGLRSSVRSALRHGHEVALRHSGYTAWQAITHLPGEDIVPSGTFFNLWGRGGLRFLYCRLNEDEVYWDAITSDGVSAGFDMLAQTKAEAIGTAYKDWPDPVPQIIASTTEQALLSINIADRPPERSGAWGLGRVVLIGDAAHPQTLNLSQGAGQAIEDGVLLARLLTERMDVPAAIAEFESLRRDRVDAMVRMAWKIGTLGHMKSSVACFVRDLFMLALFNTKARANTYRLMMDRVRL